MQKALAILLLSLSLSLALEAEVFKKTQDQSNIMSLSKAGEILLIGTDLGSIELFNLKEKKSALYLQLAKIENYYEDKVSPRVFSLDMQNDKLLILSEASFGGKNLSLLDENKNLQSKKLAFDSAKKAFLLDDEKVLLALSSARLILLDFSNLKVLKEYAFSHSSLNDAVLNEDKNKLVAGFESGEVKLFDLKSWQEMANFDQIHKDSVYSVDFKNSSILSCATDRKVGLVQNGVQRFVERDFLIYTCALSANASTFAFGDSGKNTLEIFSSSSLKRIQAFENLNFSLEHILFLDEKTLLVSGYNDTILIFTLNEG